MNTPCDLGTATFVPTSDVADNSSPTILCVDDDPCVSEALARAFHAHGIRVLRAFLGMQGLWMAVNEKPDVIILDLAMPKGHGTEILECLKRHPQTVNIPVVILTGSNERDIERKVKHLGAVRYFQKPIPFTELLAEISQYIAVHI